MFWLKFENFIVLGEFCQEKGLPKNHTVSTYCRRDICEKNCEYVKYMNRYI